MSTENTSPTPALAPIQQRVTDLHEQTGMPWEGAEELALYEAGVTAEQIDNLLSDAHTHTHAHAHALTDTYLLDAEEMRSIARSLLVWSPLNAVEQPELPQDDFKGDDAKLVSCINALLTIDAAGTLLPHGIGGHARALLAAAASRLAAATAAQPETLAQAICKLLGRQHPEPLPDHTILACIENMRRRSECLGAIEREFFTVAVPDEDGDEGDTIDDCLLNWGEDPDQYVETFRVAMATMQQAAATAAQQPLPAAVIAWRDAYGKYVAAVGTYNTRLAAINQRVAQFPMEFGKDDPHAEWRAMEDAQRAALGLLRPMFDALVGIGLPGVDTAPSHFKENPEGGPSHG